MSSFNKKRSASFVDDSDGSPPMREKAPKKSKKAGSSSPSGQDDDGNPFWNLSDKRRIGISNFKNNCFINIREYYEKDGKTLPGKKGIALTLEQYAALLRAVPGINTALKEQGHKVDDAEMAGAPEEVPAKSKGMKEKKSKSKANIEATSDEEEND